MSSRAGPTAPRACMPCSSESCSAPPPGPAGPPPAPRSSGTSRAGTTCTDCTAASATAVPLTTRPHSQPDHHAHGVRQSGTSSLGLTAAAAATSDSSASPRRTRCKQPVASRTERGRPGDGPARCACSRTLRADGAPGRKHARRFGHRRRIPGPMRDKGRCTPHAPPRPDPGVPHATETQVFETPAGSLSPGSQPQRPSRGPTMTSAGTQEQPDPGTPGPDRASVTGGSSGGSLTGSGGTR